MVILLSIAPDARAKLDDLLTRRSTMTIDRVLATSRAEPPDTAVQFEIAQTIGVRDANKLWLRSRWIADDTSVFLIGHDAEVVEVVTFRGLRQLRKRYKHRLEGRWPQTAPRDKEALKWTRPQRIGGGLLRGKLTPRKTQLSIISTHCLRQAKDE